MKVVNILLTEKDEIIENFNAIKDMLFDTQALETERSQLHEELNVVAELIQQCIKKMHGLPLTRRNTRRDRRTGKTARQCAEADG